MKKAENASNSDRAIPFAGSDNAIHIEWVFDDANKGLTFNPNTGALKAASYVKRGGTASQVLMADGSVQSHYKAADVTTATSDDGMITPLAMNRWTAKTYVTALGTSGNYLTWTKNGSTNNITVPYATNADTVDGVHESGFFRTNRGEIPTAYIDLTNYSAGASGYANYLSGTYTVQRSGYAELFVNLARNAGSTSALQFYTNYSDGAALKFRKTIDSNRVSGPWRTILTELNYSSILDSRYYTESEADSRFVNASGDTMTGRLHISSGENPLGLNSNATTGSYIYFRALRALYEG